MTNNQVETTRIQIVSKRLRKGTGFPTSVSKLTIFPEYHNQFSMISQGLRTGLPHSRKAVAGCAVDGTREVADRSKVGATGA